MNFLQRGMLMVALASNIAAMVMSILDRTGFGGYFNHSIEELNQKYYQEVTPDAIIFDIIWPIIFLWNLAGILYIVASVALPAKESPVNYRPTLISSSFLLFYSIGFLSTIAWLFAFDREKLGYSFGVLLVGTASLCIAIGISYKLVYDNLPKLETNSDTMLWLIRVLLQNGLALFATWLTVASLLGMCDLILYQDSPQSSTAVLRGFLSEEDASTLTLALLLAAVIVWFIMENFVWQKYCLYTFTIYPVFILALGGLVDRLRYLAGAEKNLVLASVDLGITGALFLARIGLSVYRIVTDQYRISNDPDRLKLRIHMY